MKIDNQFTVSVPIDRAWEVLTDLEGIAPCLPGAQLTGRDGDDFLGKVKIKVGPVTANYTGTATFAEKDDAAHRAVIDATGRDTKGAGNASAHITAELRAEGGATLVRVETDLKISGKVAQFGRNVITEISEKLLGQFVDCLEDKLANGSGASEPEPAGPGQAAVPPAPTGSPAAARPSGRARPSNHSAPPGPDFSAAPAVPAPGRQEEPEALDLMALAGGSMAKRLVPLAVAAAVAVVLVVLARHRRR